MKTVLTCSLIAAALIGSTPVFAQGVFIGPNGVGVDSGVRHHRVYRDDDEYYGRNRGYEEGRSVYRPEHRDRYDYDR